MKTTLPQAVRTLASELVRLPGVGPKSAQRLALHLLRQPKASTARLAESIATLHANVKLCAQCAHLSEKDLCTVCMDESRITSTLCVVEDSLDVDAIERTGSYKGLYHVLGGVLSPIEGVSVHDLTLDLLFTRVNEGVSEIILALDPTLESEATARYITSQLSDTGVSITRLARGLPTGGDIEFADALTLSAAFAGRKTQ